MRKIRSFLVTILLVIVTFFIFSSESYAKERASSGGTGETTSIHLMKVDEEWVALSGATLQVFDVTDPSKTFEPFTTYGGLDTINDLTIGHEYILKELQAPEGYECAPDIHFKVTGLFETEILNTKEAYQHLTQEDKYKLSRAAGDTTVNLIMVDPRKTEESTTNIPMMKVDNEGTILGGATLQLFDLTDPKKVFEPFITSWSIDYLNQLIIGHEYELRELKAPEGYECSPNIRFKVTGPYQIQITNPDEAYGHVRPKVKEKINRESSVAVNLIMVDLPIPKEQTTSVTMAKVDENYQFLPGADLTLNDMTDTSKPEQTFTSTEDGIVLDQLIVGHTYRLKETKAPEGYELAEDIVFEVTGPCTVKIISGIEQIPQYYQAGKKFNFFMMDKKKAPETTSQISMMKVDEEQQPLPGAKLTLSDETDAKQPIQEYNSTNEKTFFKDLIIGHTYRLKEVEAPEGYELAEDIIFKVKNSTEIDITSDMENKPQTSSHPSANICMIDKKKKIEPPIETKPENSSISSENSTDTTTSSDTSTESSSTSSNFTENMTSTSTSNNTDTTSTEEPIPPVEPSKPEPSVDPEPDKPDKPEPPVDPEPDKPDKPEPPVDPEPDKPDTPEPPVDPEPDKPDTPEPPVDPGENKPPVDSNSNSESDSMNHSEGSSSENIDTTPEKPTPLPPVVSPDSSNMESINTEHESSDSTKNSQSESFSSQDSTDSSTTQNKNTHSNIKDKKKPNYKKNQINNKDSDNQKDLPQTSQKEEHLLLWIGILLTIPFITSIYLFHKKKI